MKFTPRFLIAFQVGFLVFVLTVSLALHFVAKAL